MRVVMLRRSLCSCRSLRPRRHPHPSPPPQAGEGAQRDAAMDFPKQLGIDADDL
jgi:hypothetical protein